MKSLIFPLLLLLLLLLNIVASRSFIYYYDDFSECSCNPRYLTKKDGSKDNIICEEKCGDFKVTCYNRNNWYLNEEDEFIEAVECTKNPINENEDDNENINNYYYRFHVILMAYSIALFAFMIIFTIIRVKQAKKESNNYTRTLNISNTPCNSDSSKDILPPYTTIDIINSSLYDDNNYNLPTYEEAMSTTYATTTTSNNNNNNNNVNNN